MFATSGRARIAYDSCGIDDGADVLLIHAGVNDRRSWHHVLERLCPRHRCVTFDMRGYGETGYEPEEGWSPVADAVAVLDAAALKRPVVVACSMGGKVAIDLTLGHPDRVGGLVLIGTAVSGAPQPDLEAATVELHDRIEAAYVAEDSEEVARLDARLWLDGPRAPEGRVAGPARQLFLEMEAQILRAEDPGEAAELPPAWPRLGQIAVPTLVLIGRLDVEDKRAISEAAAEAIPQARLDFLDGVAHLPHLEADPATLEKIEAFVAQFA